VRLLGVVAARVAVEEAGLLALGAGHDSQRSPRWPGARSRAPAAS
jgi:hypothetical protein